MSKPGTSCAPATSGAALTVHVSLPTTRLRTCATTTRPGAASTPPSSALKRTLTDALIAIALALRAKGEA